MSRDAVQQTAHGQLEERAQGAFESKLQALSLGLDQIDQQSLPELEASLERVTEAMRHPEQFGTVRLKMNTDAAMLVMRTTAETQFEVGIFPILLQRKARILERIKALRPASQLSKLREHIVQRIDDPAIREDLLALVEAQRQQQEAAAQLDTESRQTSEALQAEQQSIFCTATVAATRTRGAKVARVAIGLIKLVIVLVVLFAAVAVAVPSLLGSPPWWVPVGLAVIVALPLALEVLDRLASGTSDGKSRSPLKFLGHKVEAVVFRVLLRRRFADRGVGELAAAAGALGLLSTADVAALSGNGRRPRRRRVWAVTAALVVALTIALTLSWWPFGSRDISATIGQPVDLVGVFRLTVVAPPACTPSSADAGATCTVTVEFTNVSGEDQNVGAGSFGDVGPRGATFYYTVTPADGQDYAIAVVLGTEFFRMSRESRFDKNTLHAGEFTRATLQFRVRDGVTSLDELQLIARGGTGRVHVRLR